MSGTLTLFMTVREVAEALGVTDRTIQRHLKEMRSNSDNVVAVEHGKTAYLTEIEATEIKKRIERSGRNDLDNVVQAGNVTTDIEMLEQGLAFTSWALGKIREQEEKITSLAADARVAQVIADADGLKTLSEVGKINGIGPRKIFELLAERRILYRLRGNWVPYQEHLDAGLFVVRERTYEGSAGPHLISQTYVTGKGEVWIARKLFPLQPTQAGKIRSPFLASETAPDRAASAAGGAI